MDDFWLDHVIVHAYFIVYRFDSSRCAVHHMDASRLLLNLCSYL
uniref:Uncharacterized protein n=1 Tax=Arundo donax TaxID=35708 RepID=A0A0A9F115_ARUDO